jgi:predicted nucleotidyltransferase component of viral defense system
VLVGAGETSNWAGYDLHSLGTIGDPHLVFKGGTLLRLCYVAAYRYAADLDFSAIDGLGRAKAITIVVSASAACRERLELPIPEVSVDEGDTAWVAYVGPLGSHPRTLKLDISETKLVATHSRTALSTVAGPA